MTEKLMPDVRVTGDSRAWTVVATIVHPQAVG